MKQRRVLVLMNDYTSPPAHIDEMQIDRDESPWIMQYDVMTHLKILGYDVLGIGLSSDLVPLQECIASFKPDIVFNLLLEFAGESIFDQNVVSYLELLGIPFTGSNPRALALARDKSVAKKLLRYHNILTPDFHVFPKNKAWSIPEEIVYPMIVKCMAEDASLGIFRSSVTYHHQQLEERVKVIHESYNNDAIAEQFIEGREFCVGVIGNNRLTALPAWELRFEKSETPEQEFYHSFAKWNMKYRERKGICSRKAELSENIEKRMMRTAKKVVQVLGLQGYARVDFRMSQSGDVYVIEANANPDICLNEDLSVSAQSAGIAYPELLKRIVSFGLSR